jgi:hypothetical protein
MAGLVGHEEPRLYTPPLRELTPDTSLGFDVIGFATNVLGMDLMPWQRWLLVHALEIVGDFGGDWHLRFVTVVTLVARQNGKTKLIGVVTLYWLYMLCAALVIGMAQDLPRSADTWEAAVAMVEDTPALRAEMVRPKRGNSGRDLVLKGRRHYVTKPPTRSAGRGGSAQLVIMDEMREQQSWDAWDAVSDTVLAQEDGLIWCASNAGDSLSVVLRSKRFQALRAIGDPDGWCVEQKDLVAQNLPDDEQLGLFEWSAAPGRDVWDREGWREANPSLGHGFLTERKLRASIAGKTEAGARTENLCQFVGMMAKPPFPDGAWEAGTDPASEIAPDSPLWWAVDVSADRMHSCIAVCGLRADRTYHVEVVAYRPGLAWVTGWLAGRADPSRPMRVAYQGKGAPVTSMAEVYGQVDSVELVPVSGPDVAAYAGRFWDGVAALDPARPGGTGSDAVPVRHRPQPVLDLAAAVARTRAAGDGAFMWDRAGSTEDISPLVACSTAYGLATAVDRDERPAKSAYEDCGLMTV